MRGGGANEQNERKIAGSRVCLCSMSSESVKNARTRFTLVHGVCSTIHTRHLAIFALFRIRRRSAAAAAAAPFLVHRKIVFSFSFHHMCAACCRIACECYIGYLFIINSIYYYLLFAFFRFILERVSALRRLVSTSPFHRVSLFFCVQLAA